MKGVFIDTRAGPAPADILPKSKPRLHTLRPKDMVEDENTGYVSFELLILLYVSLAYKINLKILKYQYMYKYETGWKLYYFHVGHIFAELRDSFLHFQLQVSNLGEKMPISCEKSNFHQFLLCLMTWAVLWGYRHDAEFIAIRWTFIFIFYEHATSV